VSSEMVSLGCADDDGHSSVSYSTSHAQTDFLGLPESRFGFVVRVTSVKWRPDQSRPALTISPLTISPDQY
jgi:hypothetical protein